VLIISIIMLFISVISLLLALTTLFINYEMGKRTLKICLFEKRNTIYTAAFDLVHVMINHPNQKGIIEMILV
jgi:hypothetical protein